MIAGILSVAWWIYVLIMSPMILFSGGVEEFILGILVMLVLLLLPAIFYKP